MNTPNYYTHRRMVRLLTGRGFTRPREIQSIIDGFVYEFQGDWLAAICAMTNCPDMWA